MLVNLVDKQQSTLYIDQTGAGKSATYFIATKIFRLRDKACGPTLVVSPLVSLMRDQVRITSERNHKYSHEQVEAALRFGLNAATINSDTLEHERTKIFRDIKLNRLDIFFITPEMLQRKN